MSGGFLGELSGDLTDRDAERECRNPDRAARVRADVWTKQVENEVRRSINDGEVAVIRRRGVDHAEQACPSVNQGQVSNGELQACEHVKRNQLGRDVGLSLGHLTSDVAERARNRTIRVEGGMTC